MTLIDLTLPDLGESKDTWGTTLNVALSAIETAINALAELGANPDALTEALADLRYATLAQGAKADTALQQSDGDTRYVLHTDEVLTPGFIPTTVVPTTEGADGDYAENVVTGGVYGARAGTFPSSPLLVRARAKVPSAPTNLRVTSSGSTSTLTWTGSSSDGGTPITNYVIYRGTSAGAESSVPYASVSGSVNTYSDTAGGAAYFYTVAAVNLCGTSMASNEGPVFVETRATATPSTTAQPIRWWRGDQIVSDAGKVTTWPSVVGGSSAQGSTGTKSTMSRPAYTTATIGTKTGVPIVQARGNVNNRLLLPMPIMAEGFTILTMYKGNYVGGSRVLWAGYKLLDNGDAKLVGAPQTMTALTTGAVRVGVTTVADGSGDAVSAAPSSATNVWNIHAAIFGPGPTHQLTSILNGGTVVQVNPAAYTAPVCDGICLLGPTYKIDDTAGGYPTDGSNDFGEIIVLPSTDLATAHTWAAYLGTEFGLTVGAN